MSTKKPEVILINPVYASLPVNPSIFKTINFKEPSACLALGSMLSREGIPVKIMDINPNYVLGKEELCYKELEKALENAVCVGLSIMTEQIKNALEISAFVRKKNPNIAIVWGGIHPTLFPEQTCKNELVDFVVVSEGELTLLELVKELKKIKPDFSKIRGLAFKKDGKIKINPQREAIDVNKLPMTDWNLLENIEIYLNKPEGIKSLQIFTSRGCAYRCAFCVNTIVNVNRRWRSKSVGRVMDEIEDLINKFDITFLRFSDENFPIDIKRMEKIADEIMKRKLNITWFMNCRADYFRESKISKKLLEKLVKSGLRITSIGAESGSNEVLKYIKKDITVEDILESAKMVKDAGIQIEYSFMVGMPYETSEQMKKTVELILKIKKINPEFRIIGPQVFRPYPGGAMYNDCVKLGFQEPDTLKGWIGLDKFFVTNYASLDDLAWINDTDLVQFITKESIYLGTTFPILKKKMGLNHAIYSFIPELRWKLKFFKFPYEKVVIQRIILGTKRFVRQADKILSLTKA